MTPDEFWTWVDMSGGPDACWEWQAGRRSLGYGRAYIDGRRIGAHRYALEVALGRRLDRHTFACHRCDNPPCCNPAHLFPGTNAENLADMYAKGRNRPTCGEDQVRSKLTEQAVREIRAMYKGAWKGPRQWQIAEQYGITQTLVSQVIHRKIWKHVA